MNKVLITGFEPFDGGDANPSQEVAAAMHGRTVAGARVIGATLPCQFGRARRALGRSIAAERPSAVVCLGSKGVRVERIAVNLIDARIADNRGRQPVDVPVVKGGPAAYWSSLPLRRIVERLRRQGIEAHLSESAGTFVCNDVFYGLMHALRRRPRVPAGFIHLPWLPSQARPGEYALPLDAMVHAVSLAVEVVVGPRRGGGGVRVSARRGARGSAQSGP